jgi:hypothetical protein
VDVEALWGTTFSTLSGVTDSEPSRETYTPGSSTARDEHDRCVIHIHIPRAAGHTLNSIIGRRYRASDVFTYTGPVGRQVVIPRSGAQTLRLIRGHISYGIDAQLDIPSTYVTFLRDPVSRVISLHRYIVENPRHHLHGQVTDMSLEDFVTSGIDEAEVGNGQTRQLFGVTDRIPDEEMLEGSKRHLREDFVAVGVTERFDESLLLLRKTLGWPLQFYRVKNATTSVRGSPSPEVRQLIESRNALDRRLYAFAMGLLDERSSDRGPSFRAELAAFKGLNAAAQVYRRLRR